ncbi:hypothetical protein DVS28_b0249 (plasmid) [Euzebya pacifica]|uniref:Uncharacterized protein n=1 Tax=Euzebya pacifica TaxID=1608957 RepID=A0A346Y6C2_9ACTN|nr:hypothetical protein [Euzebya pacifica]AXV10019.1 hypothetical protein DVS28_b0249 [Euzebya pacifica]
MLNMLSDREADALAAVRDALPEPYQTLRLPTTTNEWHLDWAYLVAVVVPDPDRDYRPIIEPDDDELVTIGRYLDHRRNELFANPDRIRDQRPLDVDTTVNTIVLAKRKDGGWCFKRASHRSGMWPYFNDPDRPPMDLDALLDLIEGDGSTGERWQAHKGTHPLVGADVR